jgi:polar amino acid transport system permease protein
MQAGEAPGLVQGSLPLCLSQRVGEHGGNEMYFDWGAPFRSLDLLASGLGVTLRVAVIAFGGAFALGTLTALMRRSHFWPLRALAAVYVESIRNTPVLLQIFVIFFGLPSVGIRLDAVTAGSIALAVNSGAYLAEIIRGGIQSISKGQVEAAASLGLTTGQIFGRIVFPQALRNIYPPVVNQFIMVLLGTSLLSAIAVPDLTGNALVVNSRTFRTVEVFTFVTLVYVAVTLLCSYLLGLLGRRLFPHHSGR